MNMINNKIGKQVIDFQKATFDSTFNVISALQDQTEKTFNIFLEAGTWFIPGAWKRILREGGEFLKSGREEFKKMMDDGFERVESYFA